MGTNENESHRLMILKKKKKKKKNSHKKFVLVWILESLNHSHRSTWIILMARGVCYV